MKKYKLSGLSAAVILSLGISQFASANVTTSAIKGQVTGPDGNAAAGTKVVIVHVPSGTTKTVTVNDVGLFNAQNLRAGGPYMITVDSDRYEDQQIENVHLSLGETMPMNVTLQEAEGSNVLVVTGKALNAWSGETGPTANFTAQDLEDMPAINRDIKDIIRNDPRIYIDESFSDAVQCAGASPRYNSLTLDGVRLNDSFGLNSNGYPTERIPFSYDSIEQVSVELAPFDVKYGSFTACNINAVTKSGGNEVKGGFFFDYTSDDHVGSKIEDNNIDNGNFTEKRYGVHFGLPLVEDKVFMFASYEKLEGVQLFNYNPFGRQVSQADLDRVIQISRDVYNYDAGGMPSSMPVEDEKLLLKLDWNINDFHRASFVYNYNDGFSLSQSDGGLTLDSHFYERGAELTSMVGAWYSDWSDRFSTEIRIGTTELDNRQISLDAASGFGEVSIRHNGTTIFLGPDDSRQSNDLYWDSTNFKFAGIWDMDQHQITFGYEFEDVTAFNLFMQHTQGEFRFNSIDDYEQGLASRVYYNNSAGTNNPTDASQEFTYGVHTFYVQDEYSFLDKDLTIKYGFRYDKYTSSDNPRYNSAFEGRYGFRNDFNLDGIDLLQPRFGFNWSVDDSLDLRGGFGLYSGGNPNVWISNAYSNDGLVQIGLRYNNVDLLNSAMTNFDGGTPGYDVPLAMYDQIAALPVEGGDGSVNAIDPNFEIPAEWKYSFGATYTTENDYIITADILHNKKVDSATIIDAGLDYSGSVTAADGRPIITSPLGRSSDYVLTNSKIDGESTIFSIGISKKYDSGLRTSFGYSFMESKDSNPMTSSVAGSNYGNLAVTDPINPGLSISDYEIPHRFTMSLSYTTELVEGYKTRFSLYGQASEGRPYSYVYDFSDRNFGDSNWNGNRQLLYIPLENDPNVSYGAGFDLAAFNKFIESNNLTRGQVTGRNAFNGNWWNTFDLKFSQDIPGFRDGDKGNIYFVFKNFGNFLNSDWGVMDQGSFVGHRMVSTSVDAEGKYVYTRFNEGNESLNTIRRPSVWQVRLGVKYNF